MSFKVGGFDVGQAVLRAAQLTEAVAQTTVQLAQTAPPPDQFTPLIGPLQQTKVDMAAGPRGTNTTTNNKPSASGPIPASDWADPSKLVGKLTQNPAGGETAQSHSTCGASNLLGATLLASPTHAARFCGNVAKNPAANLTLAERAELGGIAAKIQAHTATFEDLNRAQGLLYKAANTVTDPDAVVQQAIAAKTLPPAKQRELEAIAGKAEWSDADGQRLGELVSEASGSPTSITRAVPQGWEANVNGGRRDTDTSGFQDTEEAALAKLGGLYTDPAVRPGGDYMLSTDVKKLAPGQSMTLRVTGDTQNDSGKADHFVTVGRRTDGTWYLYNPDPSKSDSTLVVGGKGKEPSGAFMAQVKRYDDRIPFDANGQMPTPLRFRQE